MKWAIIILIMMSLIGSMMWMMPSQRQKFQAKLRLKARELGFQVQLLRLTAPRAEGEMEGETSTITAYRMLRTNLTREQADQIRPWQIHRVRAVACDGLPDGWSWAQGEGELSSDALTLIASLVENLPGDVVAVESSPIQVSVFWREEGEIEVLDLLKQQLERVIEARI